MTFKKKTTAFHFILGTSNQSFVKSKHFKHHFCPNFPQTCPNFPQTCPKTKNNMTSTKKTSALCFGTPFLWNQSTWSDSHILPGFSANQNFCLCGRTPASHTTARGCVTWHIRKISYKRRLCLTREQNSKINVKLDDEHLLRHRTPLAVAFWEKTHWGIDFPRALIRSALYSLSFICIIFNINVPCLLQKSAASRAQAF